MRLEISRSLHDRLLAEAAASPAQEVCGLLFGNGGRIDAAQACRNVAGDPARAFEIDPQALIAAHRAAREGGPAIIGCYHSHPGGPATPSLRDVEAAAGDGAVWLIFGQGQMTAWRSTVGDFAALELTVVAPGSDPK